MSVNKNLFIFVFMLISTTSACTALESVIESVSDLDSNTLYQDDFSDSNSGWSDSRDENSFAGYQDSAYRIEVTSAYYDVWVVAGVVLGDVSIQVEATKIGGSDNNDFGLICRAEDLNNFYAALISSDGYYGLFQASGQRELILINEDDMLEHAAIKQGDTTNIIRLDCVGNLISLYVNGELVAEAMSDDFTSGDIGLLVGTFEDPLADISFDNLVVTKPQ